MTNVLKNAQGVEIPPRPNPSNKEHLKCIIEQGVEILFKEKHCPFDENEKQDLISSLNDHYYYHVDEYDLAKDFDDEGWLVDRDFVSKLEEVTGSIEEAVRNSEKAWFDAYKPAPPFAIGTRLKLLGVRGVEHGLIDSIYEYSPAYYTVKLDGTTENDTSRRLIRFEDAVEATDE